LESLLRVEQKALAKMIRKSSYILFFVLLVAYALFQGRYLILGPRVVVESPINNNLIDAGVMIVSGQTKNVSSLTLDDRQIYTDVEGRFEEKLIAHPGINIIKLSLRDRFGREREELVRVVAQ
jgi:hypothetical protein